MLIALLIFLIATAEEILETLGTQFIIKNKPGKVAALNFVYSVFDIGILYAIIAWVNDVELIFVYAAGSAFGGWLTMKFSLEPFKGWRRGGRPKKSAKVKHQEKVEEKAEPVKMEPKNEPTDTPKA